MGSVGTLVGVGGLLALAIAVGMLVATGLVGRLLVVSAITVAAGLWHDAPWGGEPVVVAVVVAALAALAVVIWGGRGAIDRPGSVILACASGAVMGAAWAAWDESTIAVDGPMALGAAIGLIVGVIGLVPTSTFLAGVVASGADKAEDKVIVSATVMAVAVVVAAIGFFVPFAGYVLLAIALWFGVRQRRRNSERYRGLRILN